MADDSELDYLRTFLAYASQFALVKHFSEVKQMSQIDHTRRILVFPGELLSVDGKFYKKRYKVKISDTSEAALMELFNNIVDASNDLSRGQEVTAYYTSTSFDVSGETTNPMGIHFDGTFFWVVSNTGNKYAFKYTSAGVYTTTSFRLDLQDGDPGGITFDDTFFWVVGNTNNNVYKYNAAGVYQTAYFDVSSEDTTPIGIHFDGTFFWVVGFNTHIIYQYTSVGVYTGVNFDVGSEDLYPTGITFDGLYFWIVGTENNKIFQYDKYGVYTGINIDVDTQDNLPTGICNDDTHLWITGRENDNVYKYERQIYSRPSTLCHIKMAYGNKAEEVGTTKRWYQDIYLDVEWCIE